MERMSDLGENSRNDIPKCATGIPGFERITGGGLPKGCATFVKGGPGSGKTTLAMQFIVNGADQFGEPGVFVSFMEPAGELMRNFAPPGVDLTELSAEQKIVLDDSHASEGRGRESGVTELQTLRERLDGLINSISAKRVVLDMPELLTADAPNQIMTQAGLYHLLKWLKGKGVTVLITGSPAGGASCGPHTPGEYMADCVIELESSTLERRTARELKIVKYRGSMHCTDACPFSIDQSGISIMPMLHVGVDYKAPSARISTGIPRLDAMLGGKGYFRGSTVLVSGQAGTGKTSIAAHLLYEGCRKGERCFFFSFDEFSCQLIRNMRSIGIDFEPWMEIDLLRFFTSRPTVCCPKAQCASMLQAVNEFKPSVIAIDSLSSLLPYPDSNEARQTLLDVVDFLKCSQVTSLFTCLSSNDSAGACAGRLESLLSPLMDTWIGLEGTRSGSEYNRVMSIHKSRGMAHSNQVREFTITERGMDLLDVYAGPDGMLTGSSRVMQEAQARAGAIIRQQQIDLRKRELDRKRQVIESQISFLRASLESEEEELTHLMAQEKFRQKTVAQHRERMLDYHHIDGSMSEE